MVLSPPIQMSLDDCLEYIADDELVEVSDGARDTCMWASTVAFVGARSA